MTAARLIAGCTMALVLDASRLSAQQSTPEQTPSILCSMSRSLGARQMLVVDLRLRSGEGNRTATADDSAAVVRAGGRILYAFKVAVLRAELDTTGLRTLLGARDGIAEVAYPVADTTRRDVVVQVFFDRPTVVDDSLALVRLGPSTLTRDLPLVGLAGEEPVGLAWGRIDDVQSEICHLFQVWVAPEHRGTGVGTALLDAAIAWARSLNARILVLAVTCGDTPAMRLYRRAGFVPIGDAGPLRPGSALWSQPMQLMLDTRAATERTDEVFQPSTCDDNHETMKPALEDPTRE